MEMFLLAFAFLCGIPTGMIVGVFLCYMSFARQKNDSTDPDYSGGI